MANFRIYNETLCPELWDSKLHLNPQVRMNLLRLSYDFYGKTKLPAPVIDVYLMGSIANYNWTSDSDVDAHIIIDYGKLQMPPETAVKTIKTAGAQWNSEHEVTIKGFKVEMNIQNAAEQKPYVTGVYSLVKDQWIRKPFQMPLNIDRNILKFQYNTMKQYLQNAINSGNESQMKASKKYLDAYRQYGLDTFGELSYENIIFKILRSRGLIKQLKDSITAVYDQEMTVDEVGEKDVKQTLPNLTVADNPEYGNPKFDRSYWDKMDSKTGHFNSNRLTADEIKALREKEARSVTYCEMHGSLDHAKMHRKMFDKYDAELKRRIRKINFPVAEGFGSGIPEKDRLKIENTDGSTRRWQVRSKNAPKTPKMTSEIVAAIPKSDFEKGQSLPPMNENISNSTPPTRQIALAIRKAYPVSVMGSYGKEIHDFDPKTGNLIADFLEKNWSSAKNELEPWVDDAIHQSYTYQGYYVFPKDEEVIKTLVTRIVKSLGKHL